MIRTTKSKKRNAIVALMLAIALTITGALAFLTAKDSATNKFTVGNVKITLTEPKWDAANPSGTLENIVAGQVIEKDPTINNVGKNSAYVYMLIEIPKVYQTDIVSKDANGNETIETVMHHPLFSFKANSGWSLVDSKVGTDVDAYDYYLYGHDAPLAPTESSTLFNEVTFANITSDFVNAITGNNIVDINIKATAYGIQSDFYNKEAGENASAATAWNLYAKQNDWKWPVNVYEGVSTLSYYDENDELVNTDHYYAGAPVTVYFAPELAKEGYSFDWVDTSTNEVAYTGMAMPDHNVDLTANYTPYDTSVEASDYFNYVIHGNEIAGYTATLYSADATAASYPSAPTTVRIPAYLEVTGNGTIGNAVEEAKNYKEYTPEFADDTNVSADLASKVWYGTDAQAINGTISVPVTEIYHFSYDNGVCEDWDSLYFDGQDSDLWDEIEPMLVPIGFQKFASSLAKKVILPDTITTIGDCSFGDIRHSATRNGTNVIESIRLSYALESIPDYAFAECQKLTEFIIPNSVSGIGDRAFFGCNQLTELTIPKNITYIGDYAFSGFVTIGNAGDVVTNYAATGLTTVTFEEPASITSVGEGAFAHCVGLENIIFPDSITQIGYNSLYRTAYSRNINNWVNGRLMNNGCFVMSCWKNQDMRCIPYDGNLGDEMIELNVSASDANSYDGVEVIADLYSDKFVASNSPFKSTNTSSNPVLVVSGEFVIPKSLRGISANGIPNCANISVEDGNEHFVVENNVLYNSDKSTLIFYHPAKTDTEFTVPASVHTIGKHAFFNSNNLKTVTMTDNVTEIGCGAFENCDNLLFLVDGGFYSKNTLVKVDTNASGEFRIKDGTTTISTRAFNGCTKITSIVMPDSVTTIGQEAFDSCISLKDVVLSKNIKTLPDMAFCTCLSLKNINLPDGLTSIGSQCFEGCDSLAEFHIPTTVTQIAEDALLDASARNGIKEELSGMTEEDIAEFCEVWNVSREWYNVWSAQIPSEMTICSGSDTSYAKTYADAKGYTFNVCQH